MKYEKTYNSNAIGVKEAGQVIGAILGGLNINTGGRGAAQAARITAGAQAAAIQHEQKLKELETLTKLQKKNNNVIFIIVGVIIVIAGVLIFKMKK